MIKKIIIITSIVLALMLVVGGYALSISFQYSTIEDNLSLEGKNIQEEKDISKELPFIVLCIEEYKGITGKK